MRIAYATDDPLHADTAPALHVRVVCDELTRRGHDVTLLATATPGSKPPDFAVRAVGDHPRLPRTVVVQPALLAGLLAEARRQRPDVIYVRQSQLNVAPALAARLLGIPLVAEVNGRLLAEWRQTESGGAVALAHRLRVPSRIEAFNVRAAAALVCVSDGIRADLDQRYPGARDRTVTVANGVRDDVFVPADRDAARRDTGLDPDARYACFVGALQPWQGLDLVIEAFAGLRDTPWRLVVVGDGPERDHLEALAADQAAPGAVTFTGRVPPERVARYVAAADACVYYPIPERGDGASPFKVYEYLACGRPVVCADLDGIRREFGDRVAYAPAASPEALAAALAGLPAGGPAPARPYVRSWAVVAGELEDVLDRVVRGETPQPAEARAAGDGASAGD